VPYYTDATDTSDDAELIELPVRPGDSIVLATDGLWDNAYESEIVRVLAAGADDVDEVRSSAVRLSVSLSSCLQG
jgi:serine/threonine protein phosphatase PrpC